MTEATTARHLRPSHGCDVRARFVGVRWPPVEREQAKVARTMLAQLGEDWTTLADWRGLLLACPKAQAVEILPQGRGFVFGERFGKADLEPLPPCSECIDPAPEWIEARWGAYVAVLIDKGFDLIRVLRDPSGAEPCFLSTLANLHIFFSDARDFVRLASAAAPDLGFLRQFLRYPTFAARRTGLEGVEELWPGECATYPRHGRRLDLQWSPHQYSRARAPLDWYGGVAALRGAAEMCVRERAAKYRRIGLRLSGGFDSSVMLGLLKRVGEAEIICLNEYWEGAPEGDERAQARAAAQAQGVELVEVRMDPSSQRYDRILAAPVTVKPTLSLFSYADADTAAHYRSLACEVMTSGQGGDHLFHRSRTTLIAADAARDGAPLNRLYSLAMETARLSGEPLSEVFRSMLRYGLLRFRPALAHHSTVMGALRAGDEADADHGWLEGARRASPARLLRIQHLVDALSYHDETLSDAAVRASPFFLSQPIMETCLRIAPYVMTAGATERALARAAFADLVPRWVSERTAKGETTRYFAAVLSLNRAWIHDILLSGRLIARGVVDAALLEVALRRDWRQDGLALNGLHNLIAAECWLRNLETAQAGVHRDGAAA